MQQPSPVSAEASRPNPPPPESRRRRFVLVGGAAFLLVGALGWYAWRWYTTPALPEISLAGADPAVGEAISLARDDVQKEPRSGAAWGRLGHVLRAHGYDAESNVCFANAQRFDPENPRWPYLQGALLLPRDPGAALPFLQQAVELCDRQDPDNTSPRLLLGETLLKQGRGEEAENHFRLVLGRQPQNPRALFDLGVLAHTRNQWKGSIAFLRRSFQARSPYTQQKVCALLAANYRRLGKEKNAGRFSRLANQLPNDEPWNDPYALEYQVLETGRQAILRRVAGLEAKHHFGEAALLLDGMVKDDPHVRYFVALGINLIEVADFEGAERALRKAIRLKPEKIEAHFALSIALFRKAQQLWQGQPADRKEALANFRAAAASAGRAVDLKPDHAFAYIYRGLALKYLGRLAEAIKCFRQAVHCRPELADPYLHLGEALAESGQRAEALIHLKRAVELAGDKDPGPRKALRKWATGRKP
jgi:tetratricopeptide (TPR) repeat protein